MAAPLPDPAPPSLPPLQVFYNNLLSLPFIGAMMLFSGEARSVWSEPVMHNKLFLAVAGLSGVIGFAIRCGGWR